jgi:hypothetical protein
MSWAVIRRRSPSRRTLPSITAATLSFSLFDVDMFAFEGE